MCDELFQYGAKPQYIVTLIAFSLQLDSPMRSLHTWYQTEMLIDLLHNALQKVDFNPHNFTKNKTWKNYFYDALLILVPTFFLFYFCST